MKTIKIHSIDPQLEKVLQKKADESGLSLSKTIKLILREALGLDNSKQPRKDEFMDLFGIWSKEDEKKFLQNISDFELIDERDWK